MKNYRIYLESGEILKENEEIQRVIIDEETFENLNVRALVSRGRLAEAGRLWLYSRTASLGSQDMLLEDKPWSIQILETIEEPPEEAKPVKQRISLGRLRGSMLETLIRQREEKEREERSQ
jgi:hypothetical protein